MAKIGSRLQISSAASGTSESIQVFREVAEKMTKKVEIEKMTRFWAQKLTGLSSPRYINTAICQPWVEKRAQKMTPFLEKFGFCQWLVVQKSSKFADFGPISRKAGSVPSSLPELKKPGFFQIEIFRLI